MLPKSYSWLQPPQWEKWFCSPVSFHWAVYWNWFSEAALQRCSWEKVFWKYAANLQENTHAEGWLKFSFFFFFFFIDSYIYIGKSVQANETTAKFIKSDKNATEIWETMLPFCQQLPQEARIELRNHKNSLRSRNIKNWFSLKVSYIHIAFLPSSIVKQMKFKFSKIRLLFFFFLLITTVSPLIDFPNCTDRLRRILKIWVNDTAKSK